MTDWTRRRALATAGAALLAGCVTAPSSSDLPEWNTSGSPESSSSYAIETVIEGLEIPWDVAFAPNGDLFLSERTGRVLRYDAGTVEAVAEPADVVDARAIDTDEEGDWWAAGGEGGMMGVAVHPDYPSTSRVYAYYTYETADGPKNKLVSYDVSDDDPAATETALIEDVPGHQVHNGGRLTVGPEGDLWVTTGTASYDKDEGSQRAADPGSLAGKVLRVTPDGSPSPANQDLGDGADPRVYTLGHRNPQGITFMPDATPIATEHGPSGRDEVNVLRPGANYGWDEARNGEEYEGTDFARPLVNSGNETWAPPGCVYYTGDAVPGLREKLLIGGLRSQRINVVSIYPAGEVPAGADGRVFDEDWMDPEYDAVAYTLFEDELGRIRHVEQGPNGEVYAITSNRDGRATEEFPAENDDRLLRIVPGE